MAIYKSDIITARDQLKYSDKIVDPIKTGGLPLIATANYTLKAIDAVNDQILLIELPAGACLLPQESSVICSDPGTTLTIDVGDAASPNRYATGIDLSAGGQVRFTSTSVMPSSVVTPLVVTKSTVVYATIKTAAALVPGTVLVFTIHYRVHG